MSNTFIDLSSEAITSHLQSGFEKHMSVILFCETSLKVLTLAKPFLAFKILTDKSVFEMAIKSLK